MTSSTGSGSASGSRRPSRPSRARSISASAPAGPHRGPRPGRTARRPAAWSPARPAGPPPRRPMWTRSRLPARPGVLRRASVTGGSVAVVVGATSGAASAAASEGCDESPAPAPSTLDVATAPGFLGARLVRCDPARVPPAPASAGGQPVRPTPRRVAGPVQPARSRPLDRSSGHARRQPAGTGHRHRQPSDRIAAAGSRGAGARARRSRSAAVCRGATSCLGAHPDQVGDGPRPGLAGPDGRRRARPVTAIAHRGDQSRRPAGGRRTNAARSRRSPRCAHPRAGRRQSHRARSALQPRGVTQRARGRRRQPNIRRPRPSRAAASGVRPAHEHDRIARPGAVRAPDVRRARRRHAVAGAGSRRTRAERSGVDTDLSELAAAHGVATRVPRRRTAAGRRSTRRW